MAKENGLEGIFFVAMCASTTTVKRNEDATLERVMPNLKSSADIYNTFLKLGFDGINPMGKGRGEMIYMGKYWRIARKAMQKNFPVMPALKYDYPKIIGTTCSLLFSHSGTAHQELVSMKASM